MDTAESKDKNELSMSSVKEIWSECLRLIESEITPQSFITWFKPIIPIKLSNHELTVQVPSQFFYEWLDENYYSLIKSTIIAVIGSNVKLKYSVVIENEDSFAPTVATGFVQEPPEKLINLNRITNSAITQQELESFKKQAAKFQTQLNPKYTFENLIKGSCNDVALAAAHAVSENPGSNSYNPLVVYGNVGLGKTHLAQAIGNYSLEHKKVNFVVYVSSEKFTIEMQNKQIVLSCDKPIKDLRGIEERLLSRFQWGLTADLQVPDYETRLAILYKKRDNMYINESIISDEIISFIAKNVDTNVRELEGCIIRLLASASIERQKINLETSKEILRDFIRKKELIVSTASIEKIVCKYYKISTNDLRGKSRRQDIAHARQIAMYLMKTLTSVSLKTIGLQLGGRDHSTVIHAYNTVEDKLKESQSINREIEELKKELSFESN
ncbi:hypothetical protein CHS0354_023885 [Potamilus streckersoni]|uniref:Chromosomal replication initiator DnaA C-terminal domain-containing protein n=1 Tax=Potamilus streckersoni TaxID=2493646 RepID=A0AAE0VL61_9BIVA|nr:hypothetical protein CHS0354_023885 [Potamilus streckersoni]